MAALAVDGESWDACVSLSVSAGVNASDAVLLQRIGTIVAGDSHEEAVRVLRKNSEGNVANQLARLLSVKHKAQYSALRCTAAEADAAYKRGERILEMAKQGSER